MRDSKAATAKAPHSSGDQPHLVRELAHVHQLIVAGLSRKTGMTASRFALMRLLWITEKDVGVMELSRQLGVNAAAVTRQVQELEGERLVQRRADPKDGRRNCVRLSPKGRKAFREVHDLSHEFELTLSSVISDEEMAIAKTVLAKLRALLEELRQAERGGRP